jgi:hypothetical protein
VFFIFGWGWRTTHLDTVMMTCPRCGNHVAHPRYKHVLRFSLFFVPLIPLRTKYTVQCTACALSREVPARA